MKFTVSFSIKYGAKGKEKPIHVLVNKTGMKRVKRTTGREINPNQWSKSEARPKRSKANTALNRRLDDIEWGMYAWFDDLEDPSKATRKRIVDKLEELISGNAAAHSQKGLFDHFDDFIAYKRERKVSDARVKHFQRVKKRLWEFTPQVSFQDLDEEFSERFSIWLVNEVGLINKTANKYLNGLSGFLNYCYKWGVIKQRLSLNFQELPEVEQEVIALTKTEQDYLENLEENDPKLQKVLDCFLFSCYTSIRYTDLRYVGKNVIKEGFIQFDSQKTKIAYEVPIDPQIRRILEKYDYSLPVYKNQPYNRYLKALFSKHGFDRVVTLRHMELDQTVTEKKALWKVVSTHVGRRTWVTNKSIRETHADDTVKKGGGFSPTSRSYNRYKKVTKEDLKKLAN